MNFKKQWLTTIMGMLIILPDLLMQAEIDLPDTWTKIIRFSAALLLFVSRDPNVSIKTPKNLPNIKLGDKPKIVKCIIFFFVASIVFMFSTPVNAQLNFNARRISMDTVRARTTEQGGITGILQLPYNYSGTYPSIEVNDTLLHEWIEDMIPPLADILTDGAGINIVGDSINMGGSIHSDITLELDDGINYRLLNNSNTDSRSMSFDLRFNAAILGVQNEDAGTFQNIDLDDNETGGDYGGLLGSLKIRSGEFNSFDYESSIDLRPNGTILVGDLNNTQFNYMRYSSNYNSNWDTISVWNANIYNRIIPDIEYVNGLIGSSLDSTNFWRTKSDFSISGNRLVTANDNLDFTVKGDLTLTQNDAVGTGKILIQTGATSTTYDLLHVGDGDMSLEKQGATGNLTIGVSTNVTEDFNLINNGSGNLSIQNLAEGNIIVTDNSTANDGIKYAGDYEANFDDRSLVTKQFVDDRFWSLTNDYQVDNGVRATIPQGNWGMIDSDSPKRFLFDNGPAAGGSISMMIDSTDGSGFSVSISDGSSVFSAKDLGQLDFNTVSGQCEFIDLRSGGSQAGIEYDADYQSDYTSRSLVDKNYSDSYFTGTFSVVATDAEIDAILGTPASRGVGFKAVIFDSSNARMIHCMSTGTEWWYDIVTKAN